MKPTILGLGVGIGVARIAIGFVEPDAELFVNIYKDLSHIYIGGLGVAWWIQRQKWQWYLFWALNIVEVVVAVATHL